MRLSVIGNTVLGIFVYLTHHPIKSDCVALREYMCVIYIHYRVVTKAT
jgi:hypothetical protein